MKAELQIAKASRFLNVIRDNFQEGRIPANLADFLTSETKKFKQYFEALGDDCTPEDISLEVDLFELGFELGACLYNGGSNEDNLRASIHLAWLMC